MSMRLSECAYLYVSVLACVYSRECQHACMCLYALGCFSVSV